MSQAPSMYQGSSQYGMTPEKEYPQMNTNQGPIMQQPPATQGMNIGPIGNRNAMNKPMGRGGQREWSFGLCDCCSDCGTCFLSWWCPCMVYAQNKSRMEYLSIHGQPDPKGGEMMNGDCLVHCCLTSLCGLGWALQMGVRGTIRNRYRINGGGCGDCCTAFWCTPCELTQEGREIQLEEGSFGGARV